MNKRQMQKWVRALRSGEYKQGKGLLRRSSYHRRPLAQPEYCCLGVLCEINNVPIRTNIGEYIPKTALSQLGMKSRSGTVAGPRADTLADKNDSGNWSFKRIATFIKKNYRKL